MINNCFRSKPPQSKVNHTYNTIMKINSTLINRFRNLCNIIAAGIIAIAGNVSSSAADGVWSSGAGGNWSNTANWEAGAVADGVGSFAYFTNEIAGDITVQLDSARTNGSVIFGDGNNATAGNWLLGNNSTAANTLLLAGSAPGFTVDASISNAIVSAVVRGANLTALGGGWLHLTAANTFTNLTIDGGKVRAQQSTALGVSATNNIITLTNGGTVAVAAATFNQNLRVKGTNTYTRTPGATGGNWNGLITGDGVLIMDLAGQQMTFGGNNSWNSNLLAGFTGTIILTNGGNFRFDINNAATKTFGSKSATFDLGTINSMNERGAGGIAVHTTFIGALRGGPGTSMSTAGSGAGFTNTFQIGDANLDTTYFGRINQGNGATSITKSGTGTLTLAGTNLYNGLTTVSNGVLALAATGSISNSPLISVVSPGVFDVLAYGNWTNNLNQSFQGNGVVTGIVTMASGTIRPGVASVDTATLTFASGLNLVGGVTVVHDVVSPTLVDKVNVFGDLNLEGVNTIQLVPTLVDVIITNGTYVLYEWTGSLIGDVNTLTLSYPSQLGTLTLSTNLSKQIVLTVTGAQLVNLKWNGNQGIGWSTANNWLDTNSLPATWADARVARFDDLSTLKTVDLSATVIPARVEVTNNIDYTFTSTGGKISGAGLLVKSGTGVLTLTTLNDYTGTTTINTNSTIQIGDGISSGSIGTGQLINDGLLIVNRPDSLTYGSAILGTGSVMQRGAGPLTLTGTHNYSGNTVVSNDATLQLGDGTINATIQGGIILSNNATLRYFNNANSATIANSLTGSGTAIYEFNGGARTYLFGAVTNTGFTGTTLIKSLARVEAPTAAANPSGPIIVENLGAYYTRASSFTNTQSISIVGQGPGSGVDLPRGFGALRLNNGWSGPITLTGNATIGGSSGTGIILGNINDGGNNYTLEYFGGTIQVGPATGVNTYGITRIAEGLSGNAPGTSGNTIVVALNGNPFGQGAVEMVGQSTLRLNGNNVSIANLVDQSTAAIPVGGVASFAPVIQNGSSASSATLTVGSDGNNALFAGSFSNGGSRALGLTKTGAGILTLSGDSTCTGTITVSAGTLALSAASGTYPVSGNPVLGTGSFNSATLITIASGATLDVSGRTDGTLTVNSGQTLGGSGTVNGKVVVASGGNLAPGSSIGELTVSGDVTLGGSLTIEVNRTASPNTDKLVSSGGVITGGGSLILTNTGAPLQIGDTFQIFAAGVSGITVPAQTVDYVNALIYTWNDNLAGSGSVSVASVTAITAPNLSAVQSGNSLTFSWTGPFKLQAQTNSLNVGIGSNWGNYPGGSTSPVNVTINPANPTVFFRLSLQ